MVWPPAVHGDVQDEVALLRQGAVRTLPDGTVTFWTYEDGVWTQVEVATGGGGGPHPFLLMGA